MYCELSRFSDGTKHSCFLIMSAVISNGIANIGILKGIFKRKRIFKYSLNFYDVFCLYFSSSSYPANLHLIIYIGECLPQIPSLFLMECGSLPPLMSVFKTDTVPMRYCLIWFSFRKCKSPIC